MIKNYFKIAWRNLFKNKVHSVINIGGLAAGIAVAILIGLWIRDELYFDKYHENYHRIAKIRQHINVNGEIQTEKTVPYPLAEELRINFPRYFKYIVMSSNRANHILSAGEMKYTRFGVYLQPEATEMLTLKMLKGTRAGLKDPYSILLSQSAAQAFFGKTDPINKIVRIDNKQEVKCTGVYEDLPANSTFASIKFIAPFELYLVDAKWISNQQGSWNKNTVQAYVQIADDADMDKISGLIRNIKLEKLGPEEARYKPALFLDPMSKWHLYSEYKNGVNAGGKIRYVWMFGIIGFFVLLLACINFMNLGTARIEKRAKEVGIRKAIGSLRRQLVVQFFCESLLVTALAFVCSLVLVQLILPFFNEVANKNLALLWNSPMFWIEGFLFTIITGLIAGSYPALYLSSFQPVRVLKGRLRFGRLAALPRKVLVVVQFTVSVTLIICTIVVFRQIQFAKDRPIGYSRDALITVPVLTNEITAQFNIVKDELLKKKAITAMAAAEAPVTEIWGSDGAFDWKAKAPELTVDFPVTGVSVDYGKTVGWEFQKGRNFSTEFATDSSALILNEAAVKYMGLQDPVGETIKWKGIAYKVIGVINDVITESPYEPVRPSVFWLLGWQPNFIFLKINPEVSAAFALSSIEKVFRQYSPSSPFNYSFVDEDYNRKFGNEERVGKLAGFFAILAIFISCIGLFGMASFMAEQRIKEIGIRKVLGASVFNLWRLLSKEFVALVMISLLIAVPAAYYFMYGWLQNYSYRSPVSWWIFAVAGLGAIIITLLTISFHAVKAAAANPVKSLKTE